MRKKKAFTELRNMTIVTPSKWLAGLVKESFLAEYNVEVINNGVDLGMFCPSSSDFRLRNSLDGKYVILGVANVWDRRKGLEYFVELVDGLHADEKIVLVGLTDQQKEELPKGIVGVTRTESVQELAGIYSAADVFVNPTLEDNFPTTNLESLACGTPVITFETGGSVEAVDEHTGLVVRKGDAKGLLDAIRHFRGFDRHSLREACLKRSKELYDKNDRFVDYMNLYRSCIVA
jgi:glycosyltransferase involved in cell wall biosynthesis